MILYALCARHKDKLGNSKSHSLEMHIVPNEIVDCLSAVCKLKWENNYLSWMRRNFRHLFRGISPDVTLLNEQRLWFGERCTWLMNKSRTVLRVSLPPHFRCAMDPYNGRLLGCSIYLRAEIDWWVKRTFYTISVATQIEKWKLGKNSIVSVHIDLFFTRTDRCRWRWSAYWQCWMTSQSTKD